MKTWGSVDYCAIIVLTVMGALLIMGRDSTLTITFCSIAGAIFTKGLGLEIKRRIDVRDEDKRKTPRSVNPD